MELSRRERKLKWNKSNYRELLSCKMPRMTRTLSKRSTSKKLYPVEVIESTRNRVRVHYVGYSSQYDEWKDKSEIEVMNLQLGNISQDTKAKSDSADIYDLHKELTVKIKRVLSCNRTASPNIKVRMPFDILLFNGGLKLAAVPSRRSCGIQYYKINHYKDLYPLLGINWHVRGINNNGDYGYAIKETVEFCIRKSRKLIEYMPRDDLVVKVCTDTGYTLVFTFTCGFGNKETFGKDQTIFV